MKPTKQDNEIFETKNKINDRLKKESEDKIKKINAKLKKHKIKSIYESYREETYTGI